MTTTKQPYSHLFPIPWNPYLYWREESENVVEGWRIGSIV
jgi:hypothetical protein